MSDKKVFKIGVMGLKRGGPFAKVFNTAFEDSTVTAVCENNPEVIEEFKKKCPNIKIYTDFDEFINSGLDAVMLANNFHEHCECAIKAMELGIAVLSETTAAPSLGDCVRLVETAERTNGKYMLAANCLYFPAVHAMKDKLESGEYGDILYGEAEYIHGPDGTGSPKSYELDLDNLHWRQTLPTCYYNMHSLGPLMYVTNSVPVKVSCKAFKNGDRHKEKGTMKDSPGAIVITEMDNGAIFNTTGCNNYRPTSKWYRIACENATLETLRYDGHEERLMIVDRGEVVGNTYYDWVTSGVVKGDEYTRGEAEKTGHGGVDYFVAYYFLKYLKGEQEPFLDVYRSAALSATGILAWYSALSDSTEYKVPDFKKKEDRDEVRGDFRSPFAKSYKDLTLPSMLKDRDNFKR